MVSIQVDAFARHEDEEVSRFKLHSAKNVQIKQVKEILCQSLVIIVIM
jgi:hypothetical protein